MKLTFLLLIVFFISGRITTVSGQQNRQHPKHKKDKKAWSLYEDDPRKAKNLSIELGMLYDVNKINNYPDIFAYACYDIFNHAIISGKYRIFRGSMSKRTVIGNYDDDGQAVSMPDRNNYEVVGTYYFRSVTKPGEETITFTGRDGYITDVSEKRDILKTTGIRAGYQYFASTFSTNVVNVKGYNVNDPSRATQTFSSSKTGSVYQSEILNLGMSSAKTTNLVVILNNGDMKTASVRISYYADFLYAPAILYSNMIVANRDPQQYNTIVSTDEYNINTYSPRSRFGFRLGFEYLSLRTFGYAIGIETGIRPGTRIMEGMYVQADFSIGLNAKIF